MFDAPLKNLVCLPFQRELTFLGSVPSTTRSIGTTIWPSLTPVNPSDFEKLHISIAHSFAPETSYMLFGRFGSEMNDEYAASKMITALFSLA